MINHVRAEATEEVVQILIWDFMKHVTEQKNDGQLYFQHGKTGFAHKNRIRKAIAVTGSKNVWPKIMEASFNMTIVACFAANVFYVPPLFILPGQQFNRAIMYQCYITGRNATVAPKGFTNSNIFIKWLDHFSSNVPSHEKRPIVLVYKGYGSHYNTDIVEKAIKLSIILVLLTYNSTHLIQPLDRTAFKPFNTV